MKYCQCGCGIEVKKNKSWVSGHNLLRLERTDAHREAISKALRRAWRTKRKRLPVGSKNHDSYGYVRVKVKEGAGRWEKEHSLVMGGLIGRALLPSEHVHHLNGKRNDNRPENLHLCWNAKHHRKIQDSFGKCLGELMERGMVKFNPETEEYYVA